MKTFSRSQGHSATAAGAYRAGVSITDDRTGLVHDYRKKSGVASTKIFAPDGAPRWATDSALLWNAAEKAETRINSRVAREFEVALPAELNATQREALAHELANMLVDRYSIAVMAAIHEPGSQGDDRNHHVHLLMTTRVIDANGFGAKVRVLDDKISGPMEVAKLREWVAGATNRHLVKGGFEARVDHRTLGEQAGGAAVRGDLEKVVVLSRDATKHNGKAATALSRRGLASERVSQTIRLTTENTLLVAKARRRAAEIAEQPATVRTSASKRMSPSSGMPRSFLKEAAKPSGATLIGDTALGIRATGADAKLLNDQATVLQKGLRAARDNARKQVAALEQTMRTSKALTDAAIRAAQIAADEAHRFPAPKPIYTIHASLHAIEKRPVARESTKRTPVIRRSGGMTGRQWAELRRAERKAGYNRTSRPGRPNRSTLGSFRMSENKRRRPALDIPGPTPRWRPPQP